jgi:GNAT superfamily N-acetyltransferase
MEKIIIRRAERSDCQRIMELVSELALYEKAPEQVTVSLEHFTDSGFGTRPVWWAFVAEEVDETTYSGENAEESGEISGIADTAAGAITTNDISETENRTKGGRVVGFALWYIRYSTWKGQRMYLEDFYVEPRLRRRGIGAMLFERLVQQAHESGLNGVVWQALNWNEPALDFYRKYGAKFDYEWVNCSLDFES